MKAILDSHSFYWFAEDAPQMSDDIKRLIENAQTESFLSVASVWELAIKAASGKLLLASPPEIYFAGVIQTNGFALLPITFDHVLLAAKLPMHHRDPFDRLIIAQSLLENIPIISVDTVFDAYGVTRIW